MKNKMFIYERNIQKNKSKAKIMEVHLKKKEEIESYKDFLYLQQKKRIEDAKNLENMYRERGRSMRVGG